MNDNLIKYTVLITVIIVLICIIAYLRIKYIEYKKKPHHEQTNVHINIIGFSVCGIIVIRIIRVILEAIQNKP